MRPIQATIRISRASSGVLEPIEAKSEDNAIQTLRALGALGLLAIVLGVFLLAAGAASGPSSYVPASHGGFPGWLSGPWHGLGIRLDKTRYEISMIAIAIGYGLVLVGVRALPSRAVYLTVIAAHLILLVGPVLFSQDLFGYLSYARLGALHGLDPYTHTSAAAPTDAVYRFLGWHGVSSPYGPLFTLMSYALVPLGVAGGVWALKLIAVAASLIAVVLVSRACAASPLDHACAADPPAIPTHPIDAASLDGDPLNAGRQTRSPRDRARWGAAFVGLNPILLAFAVGGGHNDTILLALTAGALLLGGSREPHPRGHPQGHPRAAILSFAAATAVKLSAGVALPLLILAPRDGHARIRLLLSALLGLAAITVIAAIGFGTHALGFLGAVRGEQQMVATHSIPAELARLFDVGGTPRWWRDLFAALFVLALGTALWRVHRGSDWRIASGWTILALLTCTAWLLPWYAIWPLPFAAVSGDRRLRAASLLFCLYALLTRLPLADPLLSPR